MKKVLAAILSGLMLLGMAACGTDDAISQTEEKEVREVVSALYGAGMLYPETWTDPMSDENSTSFTRFYCLLNPYHPFDIPASDYEPFIMAYFDISAEELRAMNDYQADTDTYWVSIDNIDDHLAIEIVYFLRIDSVERENGKIKVSYRTLFRHFAPSSHESDTLVAGYVLLKKNGAHYRVESVTVTEHNGGKFEL